MTEATDHAVDVIVPLRNEVARIPEFLAMIASQTLRPRRVIVADGMSTDGSREALRKAQRSMPELHVVDNPRQVVPSALNLCLQHVESPLVARMDTHAYYEPDYLRTVVDLLLERPDVGGVGGLMESAGVSPWGRATASILRRRFGLGGARHRVAGDAGPIPHVFSGCYRTSIIRGVGGWDERYHANEDFEADTRIRESGVTLWLEPAARSTWYVRESPLALCVQMWRYGYFKSLTLREHPASLQPRQIVPPALLVGLVGSTLAAPRIGVSLAAAYAIAAGALGANAARADGESGLRGAVVPPLVHLSWGAGLLGGGITMLIAGGVDIARRSRPSTNALRSHRATSLEQSVA